MSKQKTATLRLLVFLAAFLLAGSSMAEKAKDSYDADKYGPEQSIVWDTPVKATFSHQTHTRDLGLSCDACHDGVFSMEQGAATKTGKFTMAAFAQGKFCGKCHNGSQAFSASKQCGSCHSAPTGPVVFTYPVKAVAFNHSIHVEKGKLACETCHKTVFTMKKGSVEKAERASAAGTDTKREHLEKLHARYCGNCHNASQAFGYLTRCTVCHIGVKGYNALQGDGKKAKSGGGKGH